MAASFRAVLRTLSVSVYACVYIYISIHLLTATLAAADNKVRRLIATFVTPESRTT